MTLAVGRVHFGHTHTHTHTYGNSKLGRENIAASTIIGPTETELITKIPRMAECLLLSLSP